MIERRRTLLSDEKADRIVATGLAGADAIRCDADAGEEDGLEEHAVARLGRVSDRARKFGRTCLRLGQAEDGEGQQQDWVSSVCTLAAWLCAPNAIKKTIDAARSWDWIGTPVRISAWSRVKCVPPKSVTPAGRLSCGVDMIWC